MSSSISWSARGGPSVLAVDDDGDTARLLSEYLHDFGMDVEIAQTGAQMKSFLDRRTFDIVLLDLMLPDIAGMDLCTWSKDRNPDLPVIMLTADDDAETCIEGLARGADDYLGKPFQPRELVARIKAVLRRTTDLASLAQGAALQHDAALRRLVLADGATYSLTEQESRLIGALIEHPGVVLSRGRLLELMHAPGVDLSDRSVDACVSNLRTKLGEQRALIRTVRGKGYLLQTAWR